VRQVRESKNFASLEETPVIIISRVRRRYCGLCSLFTGNRKGKERDFEDFYRIKINEFIEHIKVKPD
jgi:hypothetical protein